MKVKVSDYDKHSVDIMEYYCYSKNIEISMALQSTDNNQLYIDTLYIRKDSRNKKLGTSALLGIITIANIFEVDLKELNELYALPRLISKYLESHELNFNLN